MKRTRIGFACAYTPLPLIDAAGCEPYRVLPVTEAQDQAGRVIHDNMCPHVKRVLDRAMGEDLPELGGVILVNSCDAMRRLADAWRQERPADNLLLVDLPVSRDERAKRWLALQLAEVRRALGEWTGSEISDRDVREAIARHDELAALLAGLRQRLERGRHQGGSPAMQRIVNDVSARPVSESIAACRALLEQPEAEQAAGGAPVYLFGNVLPDPAAFELFEQCGARVVADDLCTGSRLIHPVGRGAAAGKEDPLEEMAASLIDRPACARTITLASPGKLAADVVQGARRAGARAVIAHVIKFCDPYLGRMPAVREACKEAGLSLLVLEGDCTLRSMGQHATRIEAFIEMIG